MKLRVIPVKWLPCKRGTKLDFVPEWNSYQYHVNTPWADSDRGSTANMSNINGAVAQKRRQQHQESDGWKLQEDLEQRKEIYM